MPVQKHNYQNRELERTVFQQLHDPVFAYSRVSSVIRNMPGLLAGWIGNASYLQLGTRYLASLGADQTRLTFVGTPQLSTDTSRLAPYVFLNGTSYFNTTDTQFDILGTETYVAATERGMSCGGWFRFSNAIGATNEIMMSNRGSGSTMSFSLHRAATTGLATFTVSLTGAALFTVTGQELEEDTWYFVAARFDPGASISLWVDGIKTENTTSIPASLYSGVGYFTIGAYSSSTPTNGEFMTGLFSAGYLCPMSISDAVVFTVYQTTKALFNK